MYRLDFAAFESDGVRGYEFVGTGTYGGLLAGDTCPTSNGGPNGIRTRVFSPPRAFAMVARSSVKLTKRYNLGDLNSLVI